MNISTSLWILALGILLVVLPGFNVLAALAIGVGAGNVVGRTLGPPNTYKELR